MKNTWIIEYKYEKPYVICKSITFTEKLIGSTAEVKFDYINKYTGEIQLDQTDTYLIADAPEKLRKLFFETNPKRSK